MTAELLQHVVFGQRPLKLIICFQQDGAVVDSCHVLEQTGIKEEQLKLVEPVKSGKGRLILETL